jgi:PilZ domain
MPSDFTVIVADAARMPAIRAGLQVLGRAMHITSGNLASAMDSIKNFQPKLVAVDAVFAQTLTGAAFIERVEKLAIADGDIRLIARVEGSWITTARRQTSGFIVSPPIVAVPAASIVAAPAPVSAAQIAAISTRRAPRFLVRDPLDVVVENGSAALIDISILGAQVVSGPVLRPSQKIKIALPDDRDLLHVTAHVAWSTFEKPQMVADAHYRAGIEFTGAAQEALEDYRRRHCADDPIPYRGR